MTLPTCLERQTLCLSTWKCHKLLLSVVASESWQLLINFHLSPAPTSPAGLRTLAHMCSDEQSV
jgi:hypothetical protein